MINNDHLKGHVARLGFGDDDANILKDLVDWCIKHGPVDDWMVPYYFRMFYELRYNFSEFAYIKNPEDMRKYITKTFTQATSALKLVSMNSKEGLLEANPWRARLMDFRLYKIHEITGMNFSEFLQLPTFYVETVLDFAKHEKHQAEAAAARLEDERNRQAKNEGYENHLEALAKGSRY